MMNRAQVLLLTSWSITTLSLAVAGAAVYVQLSSPPEVAAAPAPPLAPPPAPEPSPVAPSPPPPPLPAVDLSADGVTMADVVARTIPSVVNISSRHGRRPARRGEESGDSLGSGVIVSAEGLVVTNNHVVEGGTDITVHLSDGRSFPADVVGTDEPSDVALLRMRGDALDVTPLAYGDSSALRQGDVVLAIGNPFGVGQTVTMGIVSAVGRADMGIAEYEDFIQTDASINPGNSGGALISTRGELVGINTAILSRTGGSHGIGFAIPSNMVRPIVESLLERGKVVRGWLGVTIQDVDDMDPALVSAMRLPASQGVLVTDLEPGSPAEVAGVLRGDFIELFDGERLTSTAQLRNLVATRGADADVTLTVVRGGERRTVTVHLGERPSHGGAPPVFGGGPGAPGTPPGAGVPGFGIPGMPPGFGFPGVPPGLGPPGTPPGSGTPGVRGPAPSDLRPVDVGGLAVVDLDTRVRSYFGVPSTVARGAVVIDVSRGTPAEDAGLTVGDVVVEVNRQPVEGAASLAAAYRAAAGSAVLLVRRGVGTLYVLMR
jgi:serine protease Do